MNKNLRKFFMILLLGSAASFLFAGQSSKDVKKKAKVKNKKLKIVETVEDENNSDRSRVFVHMDNGDVYELKMEKLSKEQLEHYNNFYGH